MRAPDDAAVRRVLDVSMVVHLATRSAKGHPFITPIWFVVDAGVLYMTTGIETRAARNVAANPEVVMLFGGERGMPPGERLRMRGTATRHAGLPPWRVLLRIAAKYYVGPRALAVELRNASRWWLRVRYYAQVKGGAGHLRVDPTSAELLPAP